MTFDSVVALPPQSEYEDPQETKGKNKYVVTSISIDIDISGRFRYQIHPVLPSRL